MRSEIRSNGSLQIRLVGESPIEKLAVELILQAAMGGQTVRIYHEEGADDELVVSLTPVKI